MAEYEKVPLSDVDEEVQVKHCSSKQCRCSSRARRLVPWAWCIGCSIVAVFAVVNPRAFRTPPGTLSKNHPTDFISAPEVPYVEKYFYNYHDFNPAIHFVEFNDTGTDGKLYAGYPTKEIDDAWEELLHGSYVQLSKAEEESVQEAAPWKLDHFDGNIYAELGVFHNLHCIDLLRRALEPDHYDIHLDFTSEIPKEYQRVHVYHCIDQLRQSIQCASDLTPVPLFAVEGLKDPFYLSHSVTHACRDFNAVKRWRDERNEKKKPFDWSQGQLIAMN